jgi:hypothetical protein
MHSWTLTRSQAPLGSVYVLGSLLSFLSFLFHDPSYVVAPLVVGATPLLLPLLLPPERVARGPLAAQQDAALGPSGLMLKDARPGLLSECVYSSQPRDPGAVRLRAQMMPPRSSGSGVRWAWLAVGLFAGAGRHVVHVYPDLLVVAWVGMLLGGILLLVLAVAIFLGSLVQLVEVSRRTVVCVDPVLLSFGESSVPYQSVTHVEAAQGVLRVDYQVDGEPRVQVLLPPPVRGPFGGPKVPELLAQAISAHMNRAQDTSGYRGQASAR